MRDLSRSQQHWAFDFGEEPAGYMGERILVTKAKKSLAESTFLACFHKASKEIQNFKLKQIYMMGYLANKNRPVILHVQS